MYCSSTWKPASFFGATMLIAVLSFQINHSLGLVISNHQDSTRFLPNRGLLLEYNKDSINNAKALVSSPRHSSSTRYEGKEEVVSVSSSSSHSRSSRRSFLTATLGASILAQRGGIANADDDDVDNDVDNGDNEDYVNPNIPASPEEKSGLVVLRVAEVAQFQEKILKAVANGDIENVTLSPQQVAFGTQIMMRNSNLDSNMKLMIYNEMPRKNRKYAIEKAVNTMNTLQNIVIKASKIDHALTKEEMYSIADMYRYARLELNEMYELLSPREKDKYNGYFMKVTEYEKKIAEGIYNPELDGVLTFDD